MDKQRVIVIGGGLAGLSAAARLAEVGHEVTLIEATREGGGRARSYLDNRFEREIDNGQHLLMGCYRETHRFLQRIGAPRAEVLDYQRNLTLDLVRPGGSRVTFRCPALPAPLHLAAGLLRMQGLGVAAKIAVLRLGMALGDEVKRPDDNETCDAWLRRLGQGPSIRAVFWDPMIWGVLNDDPLVASAAMLLAVIERAFMSTRDASRMGVPTVPLQRMYVRRALSYLRDRNATLRLGQRVVRIQTARDRACGVQLRGGETVVADTVISAVPHHVLPRIVPDGLRSHPVLRGIAQLDSSPILSLWATIDRPLLGGSKFMGLIGSPLHWVFDRDAIEGTLCTAASGGTSARLITATISGARAFVDDRESVLQHLFTHELRRYFPNHPVNVLQFRAIKEKRATISHAAGSYRCRPATRSPLPGLLLAGDWVQTGLPATIESAVQSGHQAAEALLSRKA
ncbi:MAG: hydroxysqualene dehydroxylase HpnE [Nannocystaceae bacterium]